VIVVFPHLSNGLSLLQDLLKFLSICSEKKIDNVGSVYYTRIPPSYPNEYLILKLHSMEYSARTDTPTLYVL
jgi:hypothetical protein